jgi:hypothetical protein
MSQVVTSLSSVPVNAQEVGFLREDLKAIKKRKHLLPLRL